MTLYFLLIDMYIFIDNVLLFWYTFFMIYYSSTSSINLSSKTNLDDKNVVTFLNQLKEINSCFDYKMLHQHSQELFNSMLQLKNVFSFNDNINLEKTYITRFFLKTNEFLQLQEFVAPIHSDYTHPILPCPEKYFNFLFENTKNKLITKNYRESVQSFYMIAQKSDNLSQLNENEMNELLSFILLDEYQIFHSYGSYMQNFHHFVSFCKHYVAFNFAKNFIDNPSEKNTHYLLNCFSLVDFDKNSLLNHKEFDLLVKLFEQSHWNAISQSDNHHKFTFLIKSFFWDFPLPNSSGPFSNKNKDHFHFLKYANLSTFNDKLIYFKNFFNEHDTLESFIDLTILKKNTMSRIHDQDGIDFLQNFLEKQTKIVFHFELNEKINSEKMNKKNPHKIKI